MGINKDDIMEEHGAFLKLKQWSKRKDLGRMIVLYMHNYV